MIQCWAALGPTSIQISKFLLLVLVAKINVFTFLSHLKTFMNFIKMVQRSFSGLNNIHFVVVRMVFWRGGPGDRLN